MCIVSVYVKKKEQNKPHATTSQDNHDEFERHELLFEVGEDGEFGGEGYIVRSQIYYFKTQKW